MGFPELEQYPVLHLNLTGKSYTDKEDLTTLLDMNLSIWETEYKVSKPRSGIDERFEMVIMAAAELTGKKWWCWLGCHPSD